MNVLRSGLARMKRFRLVWKWILNFDRGFRFSQDDSSDQQLNADIKSLRSEGIIIRPAEAIFDEAGLLLLEKITALVETKMGESETQDVLRRQDSGSDTKDFYLHLLGKEFEVESPFIQLAIQDRLLGLVNGYMGMRSYLRSVQVWLHFPTPGDAKETQLWHRDDDDLMNVKVFIYLNDVDKNAGPFCFIPRTHPLGNRQVNFRASERVSDAEMAAAISPAEWKVCTGLTRTVILADTVGYHRGLKPVGQHRLVLALQYTSGRPRYSRALKLQDRFGMKLSEDQKYALYEAPRRICT